MDPAFNFDADSGPVSYMLDQFLKPSWQEKNVPRDLKNKKLCILIKIRSTYKVFELKLKILSMNIKKKIRGR